MPLLGCRQRTENLCCDNLSRFQIDDRLQVSRQLVSRHARPELLLEHQPLLYQPAVLDIENLHPVATVALGRVKRRVGVRHQLCRRRRDVRPFGDADTHREPQVVIVDDEGLLHGFKQTFSEPQCFQIGGRSVDEDGDRVSADPRQPHPGSTTAVSRSARQRRTRSPTS